MAYTYELEQTQFVPLPRGEVFPFFAEAGNLQEITPEFLHFRILSPQPIVMRPGTLIDYQIRLFGVPLKWQTRIESFEPPHRFSDVQVRGPYKLWHHTHEFQESAGGTLVIDKVRYQMPLGPIGRLVHAVAVKRTLTKIFNHRRNVIERLLISRKTTAAS